jgi:hypothetical protein
MTCNDNTDRGNGRRDEGEHLRNHEEFMRVMAAAWWIHQLREMPLTQTEADANLAELCRRLQSGGDA